MIQPPEDKAEELVEVLGKVAALIMCSEVLSQLTLFDSEVEGRVYWRAVKKHIESL